MDDALRWFEAFGAMMLKLTMMTCTRLDVVRPSTRVKTHLSVFGKADTKLKLAHYLASFKGPRTQDRNRSVPVSASAKSVPTDIQCSEHELEDVISTSWCTLGRPSRPAVADRTLIREGTTGLVQDASTSGFTTSTPTTKLRSFTPHQHAKKSGLAAYLQNTTQNKC
jgi:hypothetical protein